MKPDNKMLSTSAYSDAPKAALQAFVIPEANMTQKNKTIKYIASFYFDEKGLLENTEVVEGRITNTLTENEVEFLGTFLGKEQKVAVNRNNVFDNRDDAEKRAEAALAWKERKTLKNAIGDKLNFLPRFIAQPDEIFISGNPLRAGEPMIAFGAQTNTWGQQDNPQKVLQIAGAIWEDIETLKGVLYVLGFANNYTKKLIGKYIIIELNSLFSCLKRLAELDPKFHSSEFPRLASDIIALEKKHKFRAIRDKVAAHRDTNVDMMTAIDFWQNITRYNLNKYIEVFTRHLNDILKDYPFEAKSYFSLRNVTPKGVVGAQETTEYKAFDEPFNEQQNDT